VPRTIIPETTESLAFYEKVTYDPRGIPVFRNPLALSGELPDQHITVRYINKVPVEIFFVHRSAPQKREPVYVLFQWDFHGFSVFVPIRYAAGQSRTFSAENGTAVLQDGFVYRLTPPFADHQSERIEPGMIICRAIIEYDSYERITRIMYRNQSGRAVSTTHFSYYSDQHRLRRVINVSLPEARNRIVYSD